MKILARKNWKKGKEEIPVGLIPQKLLRIEIIRLLGGKCVRCGFDDIRALQIDHVYGGGQRAARAAKRSNIGMYSIMHEEIIAGSKKYQVLCANCNWIKRHEKNENGNYAQNPKFSG
jgi:hypothetical protein